MTTIFLACIGLGATILVLQIVLALFGLDPDADGLEAGSAPDSDLGEGFSLLSVRSLSAGVAFWGLGGLAGTTLGLPAIISALVALIPAFLGMYGTAMLMRQILRLESDGSLNLQGALGAPAQVYLTIPRAGLGPGKVHLLLQGRTVELQAITTAEDPLPTGSEAVVVGIVDDDTVEVLPASVIQRALEE